MGGLPTDALEQTVRSALNVTGDDWSCAVTDVGTGQVARCRRYEFTRGDVTRSAVAKVPSADETSRATARVQALYQREVAFYRELAAHVATRTPEVLFTAWDEDTDEFALVLEDLSPAAVVQQTEGLSADRAARALTELAGLHAGTAGHTALFERPWLAGVSAKIGPLYAAILPGLFERFFTQYADEIDEPMRQTVTGLAQRLLAYSAVEPAVRTVTHTDYRSENLLFDGRGGEVPVAVVDWQTVSTGSPLLDVAYFLVTSLTTEQRRKVERDLIDHYLAEMRGRGVALPRAAAESEYARYTLQPVLMLVAASVLVERTGRGDEMFLTMIRRGVEAAGDWNALGRLAAG